MQEDIISQDLETLRQFQTITNSLSKQMHIAERLGVSGVEGTTGGSLD